MSADESREPDEKQRVHRRGFFTEGFRNLIRPIADIVEKRLENVDASQWRDAESDPIGGAPGLDAARPPYPSAEGNGSGTYLRPPGAIDEERFLETCASSGRCIEACPVAAIKPAWSDDPLKDRKPVIEARLQACVVCDDLSCMKVCPSGALQRVEREQIDMGLAVVDLETCVRSQGEDCQICVDKCPLGASAIDIPFYGGDVEVNVDGCVGCGVCELYCPTEPKAVVIEAREPVG